MTFGFPTPARWLPVCVAALTFSACRTVVAQATNESQDPVSLVLYAVDDLPVYRLDAGGEPLFDPTVLVGQLTSAVDPDSWKGKECSLTVNADARSLIIRQRAAAHQQIASMLEELRFFSRPVDPTSLAAAIDEAEATQRRVLLLVSRPGTELTRAWMKIKSDSEFSVTSEHYIACYANPEQFAAMKGDAALWGTGRAGIWVLDGEGSVRGHLAEGDAQRLQGFLKRTAVPLPTATRVFDQALAEAADDDKRVLAVISGPGCIHCQRLKALLTSFAGTFEKEFRVVLLDTRMSDVEEVGRRLGRRDGEIPWYATVDGNGRVSATSESEYGNIGYPFDADDRAHFRSMFESAESKITGEELDRVIEVLEGEG